MPIRRIYQNDYPYFVTTNTFGGYPFFTNDNFVQQLSDNIFKFRDLYGFDLYAYSTMPTHLHIILKANPPYTISQIMCGIKSKTATELCQTGFLETSLWQASFYDRILKSEYTLNNTIKYLRQNPIKDNLEMKYSEMPYLYINEKLLNKFP